MMDYEDARNSLARIAWYLTDPDGQERARQIVEIVKDATSPISLGTTTQKPRRVYLPAEGQAIPDPGTET